MIAGGGYRLDITCCFCGGSLEVDEASRTVRCRHCGSVLRIARDGHVPKYRINDGLAEREVRFLIEHDLKKAKEPLTQSWHGLAQVLVPFWRITGMVLTIRRRATGIPAELFGVREDTADDSPQTEVTFNRKDVTFCANEDFPWGVDSLGVRTQVATLLPLERDFPQAHHLVPLTIDLPAARKRFERTVLSAATAVAPAQIELHTRTVGTEISIIYFPLWIGDISNTRGKKLVQFDPVARRVVALCDANGDVPTADMLPIEETPSLQIVPHRCPNCGADLPDRGRSVAFFCANCRRLFLDNGQEYRECAIRTAGDAAAPCRLFPFWVFNLSTIDRPPDAALHRNMHLLQFREDSFFVPAFEITNPARLLRLVTHYNRCAELPVFEARSVNPETLVDATLSANFAGRLVFPLALAAAALKGLSVEDVPQFPETRFADPQLVWLPYLPERYFWQEALTGAAIERAAVRC